MGQTHSVRNNYHVVDDLRIRGWMVAVHNDYKLRGRFYTFWLFTKGDVCVKGEGSTDTIALDIIVRKVLSLENESGTKPGAQAVKCRKSL